MSVEGLPTTAIVSAAQNCNKNCAENHHDQAMRLSSTAGRPPGQATSWCQAAAAHEQSSAATTPTTTHGKAAALRDGWQHTHELPVPGTWYRSKKQEGTRTQTGPQEHRQTNGAPPQTRPNGIGTGQGTRTIRPAGHHKRQTDSSHARTRSARGHTQAGPLTRKGPDPWRLRDRRRLRAGPDRAAPTSSGRGRGP